MRPWSISALGATGSVVQQGSVATEGTIGDDKAQQASTGYPSVQPG